MTRERRYTMRKIVAGRWAHGWAAAWPAVLMAQATAFGATINISGTVNDEGCVGTDAGGKQRNGFKIITQRIVVEE